MKYYPQSLASAALSANKLEKSNIRQSCQKIFEKKFRSFESLTNENKEQVLSDLSDGEGVIPYEKLRSQKDLDVRPEGEFFAKSVFFRSLKDYNQ